MVLIIINYTDHMEFNFNRGLTFNTKPHPLREQAHIPKTETPLAHFPLPWLGVWKAANSTSLPLGRASQGRERLARTYTASGWKAQKTLLLAKHTLMSNLKVFQVIQFPTGSIRALRLSRNRKDTKLRSGRAGVVTPAVAM